jgi:hypothetical protein
MPNFWLKSYIAEIASCSKQMLDFLNGFEVDAFTGSCVIIAEQLLIMSIIADML